MKLHSSRPAAWHQTATQAATTAAIGYMNYTSKLVPICVQKVETLVSAYSSSRGSVYGSLSKVTFSFPSGSACILHKNKHGLVKVQTSLIQDDPRKSPQNLRHFQNFKYSLIPPTPSHSHPTTNTNTTTWFRDTPLSNKVLHYWNVHRSGFMIMQSYHCTYFVKKLITESDNNNEKFLSILN